MCYNSGKNLDFDELDIPKHKFNSDNEGLYRAQEIVSPYQIEKGQYEKKFSLHQRKYYKRDKDFTPEERSKILARVKQVGATRAADEFGTRRWVIMQWLDNIEKFGSIDHPKHKDKKYKNKKRNIEKQNFVKKDKFAPKKIETEAEIPKFKDFKFNFEDFIEQEAKQDEQLVLSTEAPKKIPLKLKTSNDFTPEERREILKLSDEIGIKKAALEAHTKIDVIKYRRKMRKKTEEVQVQTKQPAYSPVDENKFLKNKIVDLQKQIKELTEKIFNSVGVTK